MTLGIWNCPLLRDLNAERDLRLKNSKNKDAPGIPNARARKRNNSS